MKPFKLIDLLIFIIGTELVGALSALISGGNFAAYYDTLTKPPFSPPASLFPVVWAILFALMGLSAYLIWQTGKYNIRNALTVYGVQLFLNFLWSPVFFGLKSLTGAFIVSILLLAAVIVMITVFLKVRRSAAFLNLPYLIWSMFAVYLSAGFRLLNLK